MPAKRAEKKPLKYFKSGLEFEFFLLDNEGFVRYNADEVIAETKRLDPKVDIVQESATNIVELNHYPKVEPHETVHNILTGYHSLLEAAEKLDTLIYPLATYPGKFKAEIRREKHYALLEKIFKEKSEISGKCVGFHYHHTMPKGVFDREKLKLRKLADSKEKTALLSAYNFLIAADPALIALTASSPYYDGKHYGKDSRIFWRRGGKKLKFMDGMYANFPLVGALPPYKQTLIDLNYSISKRYQYWKKVYQRSGIKPGMIGSYKSILDTSWNPVKVNKHDTLEQKGMDMNYMDVVMGVTTTLNYVLERIQKHYLQAIPSDIGLEEPFKVEGNIMHLPPHTFVRNKLQYFAAKDGFEHASVYNYCKAFVKFAKSSVPKDFNDLAKPVYDLVAKKKNVSDNLLSKVKRKGFEIEAIPNEFAAELALGSVETGRKRLKKTERLLKKLL